MAIHQRFPQSIRARAQLLIEEAELCRIIDGDLRAMGERMYELPLAELVRRSPVWTMHALEFADLQRRARTARATGRRLADVR